MAEKPDYARLVAEERAATRQTLASLSPDQWSAASLCEGWTVRDVACHLASAEDATVGRFLGALLASGFSPDRAGRAFIERWKIRSTEEVLEAVGSPRLTGAFKLMPWGALSEAFIHGQDIRRPLGIAVRHSEEILRVTADVTCTKPIGTGAKKRIRGLRLRATDVDWSFSDGPEVSGPAEALIMAANGRRSALEELDGPGREILAGR